MKIIEYEDKYLEDVRDLLVELEEYIVSIDEDELDHVHPEYREKMALLDLEEVKDEFLTKIDEIKMELEDLDKEKVLELSKEKTEALKAKTMELIELAKEKGTPVLEKTAEEVRQKTIAVVKDVLNRLENPSQKA